jgi:hypothetical protein
MQTVDSFAVFQTTSADLFEKMLKKPSWDVFSRALRVLLTVASGTRNLEFFHTG